MTRDQLFNACKYFGFEYDSLNNRYILPENVPHGISAAIAENPELARMLGQEPKRQPQGTQERATQEKKVEPIKEKSALIPSLQGAEREQREKAISFLGLMKVINNRLYLPFSVPHEIHRAIAENPELEAELILRKAKTDADLMDAITERASIRWSNGLSDSLLDAVLCNIRPLNEKAHHDEKGKIILRPRTDWEAELKKYR